MKYKKLKIAIVSDAIYPYNKGGKEKRIFEISTRLAKGKNEVHIYCMKWWKGKKKNRVENGVYLHSICNLHNLYSGERRSIFQAAMFALSTLKLIREDFDILEVDHMPHLVLFPLKIVSLLKRKKLHATWSEVWGRSYWVRYMGILGNIAYLIEWLSSRMPDEIIAVSEHTKLKLQNELKVSTTIDVIPNGIDIVLIEKIKQSTHKSDIIFAGRLLSNKNVDYIIESVNLLKKTYPNVKCIIVGKGPEEFKLKKLVEKLNLQKNITFYNFLKKHEDLYALMKSSKVFVFPSTREGFGIVALEANACGLPVITTNHNDNATKELISNGKNGYITTLNSKEIAAKTLLLINSPLKINYRDMLSRFEWKNIKSNVEEKYNYA